MFHIIKLFLLDFMVESKIFLLFLHRKIVKTKNIVKKKNIELNENKLQILKILNKV